MHTAPAAISAPHKAPAVPPVIKSKPDMPNVKLLVAYFNHKYDVIVHDDKSTPEKLEKEMFELCSGSSTFGYVKGVCCQDSCAKLFSELNPVEPFKVYQANIDGRACKVTIYQCMLPKGYHAFTDHLQFKKVPIKLLHRVGSSYRMIGVRREYLWYIDDLGPVVTHTITVAMAKDALGNEWLLDWYPGEARHSDKVCHDMGWFGDFWVDLISYGPSKESILLGAGTAADAAAFAVAPTDDLVAIPTEFHSPVEATVPPVEVVSEAPKAADACVAA